MNPSDEHLHNDNHWSIIVMKQFQTLNHYQPSLKIRQFLPLTIAWSVMIRFSINHYQAWNSQWSTIIIGWSTIIEDNILPLPLNVLIESNINHYQRSCRLVGWTGGFILVRITYYKHQSLIQTMNPVLLLPVMND